MQGINLHTHIMGSAMKIQNNVCVRYVVPTAGYYKMHGCATLLSSAKLTGLLE